MEITYDTIINYLVKNNTATENTFSNKKYIFIYSDKFPVEFSNILQTKFYKYGITQYNKKENISFYTSLLTLLNKHFISFTDTEELEYITTFKNSILESLKNFNISEYLKSYLQKNKLVNKDLANNLDVYYFQTIVEILNINIIILDFDKIEYNILYPDPTCDPWKPTIILANYKESWEPIMFDTKSKRTFSYNDTIIKKILTETNIKYYNSELINKKFVLNIDLKQILNIITPNENNESLVTFIKTPDNNEHDTTSLNKLTKTQLFEMCKIKNIKFHTKMLKKELIDLIINH